MNVFFRKMFSYSLCLPVRNDAKTPQALVKLNSFFVVTNALLRASYYMLGAFDLIRLGNTG